MQTNFGTSKIELDNAILSISARLGHNIKNPCSSQQLYVSMNTGKRNSPANDASEFC